MKNRLVRITPTWKPGGQIDYSHDSFDRSFVSTFGDALDTAISVAKLVDKLEEIGVGVGDFDRESQKPFPK
eukprot:scaffold5367_cov177-Amphora_coffeaeformis.AAC.1